MMIKNIVSKQLMTQEGKFSKFRKMKKMNKKMIKQIKTSKMIQIKN